MLRRIGLTAVLLAWLPLACAQLAIEITGAGAQRIPIAIAPLAGEKVLPPGISTIVRADLERSGLFRGLELPPLNPEPNENANVNYAEWRSRLADALVVGSVTPRPDGRFDASFRLYDVVKQKPIGGVCFPFAKEETPRPPHRIPHLVYQQLDGE